MALLRMTSVFGFIVLLYLSSFVLFAFIRIVTGVSIQRVGYLSLRHIAYSPGEGLRIDIRGLGLSLHRPNFAQPTWLSLRLKELKITVNHAFLSDTHDVPGNALKTAVVVGHCDGRFQPTFAPSEKLAKPHVSTGRSQLWKRLTDVKEKLKRIHRKIHWLRMLDVIALNTTVDLVGVGNIQIGTLTMAVDTRRKTVDRGRLFRHKKDPLGDQQPAEWIFTIKNVLITAVNKDPVEVVDVMTMNVHGVLYKDREGLRDTSIAIKVGRMHIPCDDIFSLSYHWKNLSTSVKEAKTTTPLTEVSPGEVFEEPDRPDSREASIVQAVADSKEFISSILRGVQEIQLAMTFIRVSREIEILPQAEAPLVLNVVTHEIGVDLHRLDQRTPAHRMYFSKEDVAHQALVAAISISVSLDDGDTHVNRVVYIPMATTTIRTTLPSKTITFTEERDAAERNANILFANLVVTSPSIDLEPRHLAQLLAIARRTNRSSAADRQNNHRLISRLLPKASIKLSIHEPVVRFVLPVAGSVSCTNDEYDMIISAISSISLDIESSHSAAADLHYSLASIFRTSSHQLYYQAASGVKHNLVVTEILELKVQLSATTDVHVTAVGNLRTFSILMVREEVSTSVYNIVRHFKHSAEPTKLQHLPETTPPSFLRRLPFWLLEFHLEGSDCSIEIAGVDKEISEQTRGVAFQLESWTADYQCQKSEQRRRPSSSRRRLSASFLHGDDTTPTAHSSPTKRHPQSPTDQRRLALHVRGFDGFIIESLDAWETEAFISLPKSEVAFSTSRDQQGPIFHINSAVRALFLHFSLYRLYSFGIAMSILKDAFLGPAAAKRQDQHTNVKGASVDTHHAQPALPPTVELITIDVRASYVQIKANMPADPPMLLQIYEVAAGQHRWSAPSLRANLLRLHAEAPRLKHVWARLVSMNNIRVDMRHSKRQTTSGLVSEKSLDITSDFLRLAVPHGLTLHRIFDNFVNTIRAEEQLHHRFKTRSNEYILRKNPTGPKIVPRISLRSKALMFELEDDPFEWKLNAIYHVGLIEQKQRLARGEAFRIKIRQIEETRFRDNPRHRTQSAQALPRDYTSSLEMARHRTRSQDSQFRKRSSSRGRRGHPAGKMRYNPNGTCSLTGSARVQAQEARAKLQEHNSRSWKKRIDGVLVLQNNTVRDIRRMFSGADEPPPDADEHETTLSIPNRPGLMSTIINDLHLTIDKPSFPLAEYPQFLHEIGKGMPYEMQYSLLIPMSISLDMGEARIMLRDFPLNLLHVPAIRLGQPPRLPSWSLRTDFVIAEEYRDDQSNRHVKVDVVPKGQRDPDGKKVPGFSLDVRRTVSPVKTYSKPTININTNLPTSISWGQSYQPVIQDMMMIFEGFTKPEIDPSDRVGFWDKIRLSFHSRLIVNWKGDGDVQLRLKGSRDPYVVTGYGAGFIMCWRSDVQWAIHTDDDPKRFMTVTSGEYVLAIPDYSHQARQASDHGHRDRDSVSSGSGHKNAAIFKKVIMKLSGNVQWLAGLVFERDLGNGESTSGFRPHYNVVLKNPRHLQKSKLQNYDAFRGFRSHHIHLSIAVAAPFDRDWTAGDTVVSNSYNSAHLSPRFFSHFFNWWSLFSGVMSLPIRQGKLWRGPEKTSKKFGRHLATIKYNLLLAPLFVAHIYKHKDAEDYQEDIVSATGLKLRLNSFVLDVHQRREYFDTISKGKSKQTRTSGMRINKAELDFVSADMRAVSASIGGTTADDLLRASDEALASYQEPMFNVDMSKFTIPDHDFSWIDMDDFVELDWILPADPNPETRILPLAFTPRFTYFRQTDHGDSIHGDQTRTSPFGDEPTHFCVMSHESDPRKVQMDLVKARLESIRMQIDSHSRLTDEHELRAVRDGQEDHTLKEKYEEMKSQYQELLSKHTLLKRGLRRLEETFFVHKTSASHPSNPPGSDTGFESGLIDESLKAHVDMDGLFPSLYDDFASDFDNRFIVHNAQIKWNNSLRNIILRYAHQVSQRRGFVYYMSRRAVKFILDIVDEQGKAKRQTEPHQLHDQRNISISHVGSPTEEIDEDLVIEARIQQLLNDAKRFVDADDPTTAGPRRERRPSTASVAENIAEDFLALNSYHVRLIAPQIQLQSEKNTKSVVMVSAKGMQFKVISIMDKARMSDEVSGLVQRRYALDMDGAQFFVTTQKVLYKFLHLYSGNKYGNAPGSAWPPWVSLEVMFDFHLNPFGFQRIIQRTSAGLRYEKYNTLRLKYNEEVASADGSRSQGSARSESGLDQLWVNFPRIRASCDSSQYYTMYIIVLDLLLYSEPLEKVRSERLEKIMLASDFSDLRGAPEMATSLQERIRGLEDLKHHFQINAKYLDRQGWQDRIELEKDLTSCEDELFFIMKAITTSQRKIDDRKASQSSGVLRWYLTASEVVWHLMREKNEPLLEFQLGNAAYERIDNTDGSNHNAMEIEQIRGLNLLSSAIYPEIISPYHDPSHKDDQRDRAQKMLQVHWYMLEAIAGIPVLEHFQVSVHPLKVQLERDLGKKLFEYIFPGVGANAFDSGNFSPFVVKHVQPLGDGGNPEAEEAGNALSPSQGNDGISQEELDSSKMGSIGRRLKPTLALHHNERPGSTHASHNTKPEGLGISSDHGLRLFKHSGGANGPRAIMSSALGSPAMRNASTDSLNTKMKPPNTSSSNLQNLAHNDERKKFALHRSSSKDRREKEKKDKTADDLSQMISRASNYMTLSHVKLDSFVVCLSYKGKGDRNLEDLRDFVFRMPVLEYRNKTWSNLDLALRLKKDVIKALISHTGAIIGNKFAHHRPSKQQISSLRELASTTAMMPNSDILTNTPSTSEADSVYSHTPNGERSASPRRSLASGLGESTLVRTGSFASSIHSSSASSLQMSGSLLAANDGMSSIRPSIHSGLLKSTLGRHFSSDALKAGTQQSGSDDEPDHESHRKKTVLLLGKKILESIT